MSIKEIVRRTGHSRQVVRAVLRGGRNDIFRIRESSLEPYLARLDTEWAAGCHNGAELFRRVRAIGYKGSARVVAEWRTRRVAPSQLRRRCRSHRPPPAQLHA
jgi:transposase